MKLDNLIQIAHNVEVGENTVMAAQVGVSGSTKIGKQCMLGGQVGLGGHITIGDNANIETQSVIISNIEPKCQNIRCTGNSITRFFRSSIIFPKLPEMYRQIAQLQKR